MVLVEHILLLVFFFLFSTNYSLWIHIINSSWLCMTDVSNCHWLLPGHVNKYVSGMGVISNLLIFNYSPGENDPPCSGWRTFPYNAKQLLPACSRLQIYTVY